MTKRLYYDDSYLKDFTAEVLIHNQIKDCFEVVLNQTAFYPISGGQPHDLGSIEGKPLLKVMDGPSRTVIHLMKEPLESTRVKCRVDWPRRFDHMQQHTGQHVLSQAFLEIASAQTIGFHLSNIYSTIDLDIEAITSDIICSAELLANKIVYENRGVETQMVSPEEMAKVNLRKESTREGIVRVVTIDRFDISACGGTHVRKTGEIGGIFIQKVERVRQRIRVEFVCGRRSLQSYRRHLEDLDRIAKHLSSARQDAPDRVVKQLQEIQQMRKSLHERNGKLAKLLAEDLYRKASSNQGTKIIKQLFSGEAPGFLKTLALQLLEQGPCWILLGNIGKQAQLLLAKSESLPGDLPLLVKECGGFISGTGGGTATLVQAGGTKLEGLPKALEWVESQLETIRLI